MSPSAGDKEAAEGDLPCGLFIPRARTVRVPWPHPQPHLVTGGACACDYDRDLRVYYTDVQSVRNDVPCGHRRN